MKQSRPTIIQCLRALNFSTGGKGNGNCSSCHLCKLRHFRGWKAAATGNIELKYSTIGYLRIGCLLPTVFSGQGHNLAIGHAEHFGFRAEQVSRPKKMSCSEKSFQLLFGTIFIRSNSILTVSLFAVNPSRREILETWVSTTMPGVLKAAPSTTLAVLRPTPGSSTSSSIVCGTRPL